jgi:SET domain-containing protein
MILPILYISDSTEKGRGVFTSADIPANTTIEISPVIELSKEDRKIIEQTKLYYYIFEWGKNRKKGALGLGYVSMYNHSYNANCEYEMDYDENTIAVKTIKKINVGEELFINYNATPDDATPVWFDAK